MCLATFNWQFCWFLSYFLTADFQKYLIVKIAYTSIVFLPFILYHFVVRFLNLWTTRARIVNLFYAISACFLVILWATDLYMAGYYQFGWGIYGRAGVLHPAYLTLVAVAIWEFIRMLAKAVADRATSAVEHNRAKFTLASFALFSCAAVEYLINYGVGFYPIGVFFILASFSVIFYAITRHRLMDINLAITRTWVFTLVYALTLGLPLLLALAWRPKLEQMFGMNWWVGLWFACALLATAAHYANLHFQRRAEERIFAEERKSHEALRSISQNMMRFLRLNVLLRQVARTLVNILQLTHAAIYLRPEGENNGPYQRKAVWHYPPRASSDLPPSIPSDSILLEDLRTVRLPRVREELRMHQQGISPKWSATVDTLTRLQASVAIPVFQQRRLLGVLVLGEKRSGRIWSQDDLNLLMVLSNQAALAIENAQLHEAEEARLIKEAIEQTAADISYGVSHQFNNRLYVISILASSPVMSLMDKDLDRLPPEEAAKWLKKMVQELKKITEEAEMGGQISKGIMSLAKAIPENFKLTSVPPLIEHAVEFVRLKHSREKVEGEQMEPEILNGVPKDLSPVMGNSAQIHDSFTNLIDNAMDAIREKIYRIHRGELSLQPEPYKGRIQIQAWEKDGWITVTVEDDGIGIEKENMRRIFAPYFTTKATGAKGRGLGGHGLGLYFIKRIMEAHGGRVQAHSEHTKWSRFTVELPAAKEGSVSDADAA